MSTHVYLSTACLHDEHPRCIGQCKFCGIGCRCDCHKPNRHHLDTAYLDGRSQE